MDHDFRKPWRFWSISRRSDLNNFEFTSPGPETDNSKWAKNKKNNIQIVEGAELIISSLCIELRGTHLCALTIHWPISRQVTADGSFTLFAFCNIVWCYVKQIPCPTGPKQLSYDPEPDAILKIAVLFYSQTTHTHTVVFKLLGKPFWSISLTIHYVTKYVTMRIVVSECWWISCFTYWYTGYWIRAGIMDYHILWKWCNDV